MKVDYTFDDPIRVRSLLFQKRGNLWHLNDLTGFVGLVSYK